jgi:hypothetical protein
MIYPSDKTRRTLPITGEETLAVFSQDGKLLISVTLELCLFPRFYVEKTNTSIYVCIGESKEDCIEKMSAYLQTQCF